MTLGGLIKQGAKRLRKSRRGVAYMEFALALPVLLGSGLLGIETINLVVAYLRVSNIAMMTADNASRVRDSIDEADILELFTGAKMSGESIKFGEYGRIILSDLEANQAGTGQWLRWQRCYGKKQVNSSDAFPKTAAGVTIMDGTEMLATDRINPSPAPSSEAKATNIAGQPLLGMGPAGKQIAAPGGTAIMVAEVAYDYQPVFFKDTMKNITIRSRNAFNVRQRADQVLKNASKIIPMSCNRYTA